MKSYMMYVCETCGKESRDSGEIMACEASHNHLTVGEFKEYKRIKESVMLASSALSNCKNAETENAFDKSVQDLVDFESKHNITK